MDERRDAVTTTRDDDARRRRRTTHPIGGFAAVPTHDVSFDDDDVWMRGVCACFDDERRRTTNDGRTTTFGFGAVCVLLRRTNERTNERTNDDECRLGARLARCRRPPRRPFVRPSVERTPRRSVGHPPTPSPSPGLRPPTTGAEADVDARVFETTRAGTKKQEKTHTHTHKNKIKGGEGVHTYVHRGGYIHTYDPSIARRPPPPLPPLVDPYARGRHRSMSLTGGGG